MTTVLSSNKPTDIHRAITEKIVAAIEEGTHVFEMPWHRLGNRINRPTNPATSNAYHGVNIIALWIDALMKGYPSGHWASYRQWQEMGAQVRKGEHGSQIIFWKKIELEPDASQTSESDAKPRFIAKGYTVFNAAQVDGWQLHEPPRVNKVERLKHIEEVVSKTGAVIREGRYEIACYDKALDLIDMPARNLFKGSTTSSPTEAFYATLFHELTHWTGHPSRLNRDMKGRFGSEAYAIEELVAELGAAFLSAELGIAPEPRPDHAAYIGDWLRVLKRDPKAITTAAARAGEAVRALQV